MAGSRYGSGFGIFSSGTGGVPPMTELNIQNTIYVSKNGDDSTGARNLWNKPFLTITAAKAVAQAGDCIYVFAGVYNEGVNDITASDVYYFYEYGSHVQCFNRAIDDFGLVKNILIDGAGVFEVLNVNFSFGVVGMQNPASTMYFRGDKMLGGGNGFNINNASSFDVEVNTITTLQYAINIRGNCRGSIKFGSIFSEGTAILFRNLGTDLVERTIFVSGRQVESEMSAFGGSCVAWINTNNTRTILKDFNLIHTGASTAGLFYNLVGNNGKNLISNVIANSVNGYGVQVNSPSALQFENCIINAITNNLTVNNGSVSVKNSQLKSANNVDAFGSGVTILNAGEIDLDDCVIFHDSIVVAQTVIDVQNNNLRIRNCKLIANSAMTESIGASAGAPIDIIVEGQCATNKPTNVNITNVVAGTNIIVDSNIGLNSNIF